MEIETVDSMMNEIFDDSVLTFDISNDIMECMDTFTPSAIELHENVTRESLMHCAIDKYFTKMKLIFDEKTLEINSKPVEPNHVIDNCAICLEPMYDVVEMNNGNNLIKLECNHHMHIGCFVNYTLLKPIKKCCICRNSIGTVSINVYVENRGVKLIIFDNNDVDMKIDKSVHSIVPTGFVNELSDKIDTLHDRYKKLIIEHNELIDSNKITIRQNLKLMADNTILMKRRR